MMSCSQLAGESVLIVGSGAVGLALASRIAPPHVLEVVARGERARQLRNNLVAVYPRALPPHIQVHEALSIDSLARSRFVVLAVKAFDLAPLFARLAPLLSPEHVVMLVSNGLNVYADAALQLSRAQPLVRALAYFGAYFESATILRTSETLKLELACAPSHVAALEQCKTLCARTGIVCSVATSVVVAEWHKVLTNIPVNLIASAHNTTNRVIFDNSTAKADFYRVTAEVRSVAAREGILLQEPSDEELLSRLEIYKDNLNSTLMDLRRGRPNELSHIVGPVQALARNYGVSIPTIDRLQALITSLFGSANTHEA